MPVDETVRSIADADDWNARVALIRRIPEEYGAAHHQGVYSAVAAAVYVPNLAPDFAYIHWREEYELPSTAGAYDDAHRLTNGFADVGVAALQRALLHAPHTLRIFRLILGFTTQEFAAATGMVVPDGGAPAPTNSRIKALEGDSACDEQTAAYCAAVIAGAMDGSLFGEPQTAEVKPKTAKPDTVNGWDTVREYSARGVPLAVFLHQRHYGGAFRQLLDATSTKRGDFLEDAVEDLFKTNGVPYVRTGSANQEEIARRFNITVRPAPDFVVFNGGDTVRAMLESKGANDGGTARDKAARFRSLRAEATRLGGMPLFAVLAGLGWKRTADALGPVVRDTDGRVFTLPTLNEMLMVQPFPTLVGTVGGR